jgi:hypothetical protein
MGPSFFSWACRAVARMRAGRRRRRREGVVVIMKMILSLIRYPFKTFRFKSDLHHRRPSDSGFWPAALSIAPRSKQHDSGLECRRENWILSDTMVRLLTHLESP